MIWTFGGDFFGDGDFRDVTLDEPPAQSAGVHPPRSARRESSTTPPASKDGGQEFFTGNIGCIGPIGRWMMPRYKTSPTSSGTSCPSRTKATKRRTRPARSTTPPGRCPPRRKHPDEGFKLMKFLCGGEGGDRAVAPGAGDPAAQERRVLEDFLEPPGHAEDTTRRSSSTRSSTRASSRSRASRSGTELVKSKIDNSHPAEQSDTLEQRQRDRAAAG